MATVFMRWLERKPASYERGIHLLTFGRLESLYTRIEALIGVDDHVLEIGCGTGALTRHLVRKAAQVQAIDVSADMLAAAKNAFADLDSSDRVTFHRIDMLNLPGQFEPGSFDFIVSSLAFSELRTLGQEYVFRQCHSLLKPEGTLLILDEVLPANPIARAFSRLIRAPLKLVTWLLTRATTHPLKQLGQKLERSGYDVELLGEALGGTLSLYQARLRDSHRPAHAQAQAQQLHHRTNLGTRLRDAWALFFRVLPPYPQVDPGLYAVGKPDETSPLLVTGNYDLTLRRLVAHLDSKADVWLLVVDSSGINVWCGAGGGFLTAERVIGAFKMSGIQEWHKARHMVLPQLCANGVDGQAIRDQTGWRVDWGPVRASDIPIYLDQNFIKDEAMRTVRFPWRDRLEMVSATLGLYALMILVPVAIFGRHLFWPTTISLLGLSYFYALALPRIPGRDGLVKSIPLALIALLGMLVYSSITGSDAPLQLLRRGIGMVALSVFVAAEMQGMSPLMRGEQANWGWEAVIAVVLGGMYWLLPRLLGWSA
jgi:ubiquinone/menaquinone biosynthesis C-methylase UbiE